MPQREPSDGARRRAEEAVLTPEQPPEIRLPGPESKRGRVFPLQEKGILCARKEGRFPAESEWYHEALRCVFE